MEPIAADQIYTFYQANKGTFLNQNELIIEFLAKKLNISMKSESPEVKTMFKEEVNKLVLNLKKILEMVKRTKKISKLNQTVFMGLDQYKYLLKLTEKSNSGDLSISDGEDSDEKHAKKTEDEAESHYFYKTFDQLSTQKQRLNRTKNIMDILKAWTEKEDFPLERLL